MSKGSDYKPPTPDQDAVTYLPVDRAREGRIGFGPTDLRGATPTGGIRLGQLFTFVLDDAMPRLQAAHIGSACDNVVRGKDTYPSLMYLSRARADDLPCVFEASHSYEMKVRWERLWVLSPTLSRLSRHSATHDAMVAAFKDDLAGLHLLSKFVEQKNPAVKRLFTRLHDALLTMLLERLLLFRHDMRRAALLSGIIATIETDEKVLRAAVGGDAEPAHVDEILGLLYLKPGSGKGSKLSSSVLRGRLQTWHKR